MYGPGAGVTESIALVQIRFVPDLDKVERDASSLDCRRAERIFDSAGFQIGGCYVVLPKVDPPDHMCPAGKMAGNLVEAISDSNVRRFRIWNGRGDGKENVFRELKFAT